MPTLHIVNGSADSGALARCLYAASNGDTVLLIGNGAYLADVAVFGKFRSKGSAFAWYVLADDVRTRNLADRVASDVGLVDDDGFVDLVVAHQPIVSWSA
jgi:sulfur relay protein TusB/DsrH